MNATRDFFEVNDEFVPADSVKSALKISEMVSMTNYYFDRILGLK
jgi:hypothetical protein